MAVRLFNEALQTLTKPDGRERNPLRAPTVAIGRCHHFQRLQHLIEIIQRFSHTHHHHIGQLVPFGQRINLVDNLVGGQIGGEPLLAGHAKLAVHLTPYLGRYAQRSPVLIRNVNSFHIMPLSGTIKILHRTVCRAHGIHRRLTPYFIYLFQQLPVLQRQVCHFIYGSCFFVI